ncbi:MAG: protease HtpX [Chlamydiota bacterium]
MSIAKRIFLFIVVNLLVILTISLILQIFHVQPFLEARGLNVKSLLLFCSIWGMGGAFISLALSKPMAKWMMGVSIINPETKNPEERELLTIVDDLAKEAGLEGTPEVGIYKSPEVNAFATGMSRNRSLVAVSSGLLNKMNPNEIKGVLGHEISHISNGDMVTMTLLQGVINAFVMFLARVLAYVFSSMGKGEKNNNFSYGSYYIFVFVFEMIFMILGSMVIATFSRFREFRADAGGAKLAGKDKMIEALCALRVMQEIHDPVKEQAAFQAFKISTPKKRGFLSLFATHPPLEERIERLRHL